MAKRKDFGTLARKVDTKLPPTDTHIVAVMAQEHPRFFKALKAKYNGYSSDSQRLASHMVKLMAMDSPSGVVGTQAIVHIADLLNHKDARASERLTWLGFANNTVTLLYDKKLDVFAVGDPMTWKKDDTTNDPFVSRESLIAAVAKAKTMAEAASREQPTTMPGTPVSVSYRRFVQSVRNELCNGNEARTKRVVESLVTATPETRNQKLHDIADRFGRLGVTTFANDARITAHDLDTTLIYVGDFDGYVLSTAEAWDTAREAKRWPAHLMFITQAELQKGYAVVEVKSQKTEMKSVIEQIDDKIPDVNVDITEVMQQQGHQTFYLTLKNVLTPHTTDADRLTRYVITLLAQDKKIEATAGPLYDVAVLLRTTVGEYHPGKFPYVPHYLYVAPRLPNAPTIIYSKRHDAFVIAPPKQWLTAEEKDEDPGDMYNGWPGIRVPHLRKVLKVFEVLPADPRFKKPEIETPVEEQGKSDYPGALPPEARYPDQRLVAGLPTKRPRNDDAVLQEITRTPREPVVHRVTLTNGETLRIEELVDTLCLASEFDGEPDKYVAHITTDGVFVMANSGDAPSTLALGVGKFENLPRQVSIERKMQIFEEHELRHAYTADEPGVKSAGWCWAADERLKTWYGPFPTFLAMLDDAVDSHITEADHGK